jgi:hypothetical protein
VCPGRDAAPGFFICGFQPNAGIRIRAISDDDVARLRGRAVAIDNSLLLSIELDAALTEAGHSKEWAPVFFLYFTGAGCMPPVVQAGL